MPASPRPKATLHSPRRLFFRSLAALAALAAPAAATATAATNGARPAAAAGNSPHLDARERAVVRRVNWIRRDRGLQPLVAGWRLTRTADHHSARQLASRTLTHRLPGEASVDARLATAARSNTVGETVYFASRSASSAAIVRAWMRSPPHRALLLSSEFGRVGVGIRMGSGGVYATADLAAG